MPNTNNTDANSTTKNKINKNRNRNGGREREREIHQQPWQDRGQLDEHIATPASTGIVVHPPFFPAHVWGIH